MQVARVALGKKMLIGGPSANAALVPQGRQLALVILLLLRLTAQHSTLAYPLGALAYRQRKTDAHFEGGRRGNAQSCTCGSARILYMLILGIPGFRFQVREEERQRTKEVAIPKVGVILGFARSVIDGRGFM